MAVKQVCVWEGYIISFLHKEGIEDHILGVDVSREDTESKMFYGTIKKDSCSDFRFNEDDASYWTHICNLNHFADMIKYINSAANRYFEQMSNCPNCHTEFDRNSVEFWNYVWSGQDFCNTCLDNFKKFAPTQ